MKKANFHPLQIVNGLEVILAFVAHLMVFQWLGLITGAVQGTIVVYAILKQSDGRTPETRQKAFWVAIIVKMAFIWLHYMAFYLYLDDVVNRLPFTHSLEIWAWFTTAVVFFCDAASMSIVSKESAEKADAEEIEANLKRADDMDEARRQRQADEAEKARLFELEKLRLELEVKNAGQTEAARIAAETEKARLAAQVEAERIKSETQKNRLEADAKRREDEAKIAEAKAKREEDEAKRRESIENQRRIKEEARRTKEEADRIRREAEENRIRSENEARVRQQEAERQQQEAQERAKATEREAKRLRWMSSEPEGKFALYEAAYEAAKEACAEQFRQPTQAEVCEILGISTKSLQNFKNEHPQFFTAAKAA